MYGRAENHINAQKKAVVIAMTSELRPSAAFFRTYFSIACLCAIGLPAPGQTTGPIRAEVTNVQIAETHSNPDDPGDLIVNVHVTIRSLDRPFVVPNCAGNDSLQPFFCMAQLARPNGKVIPVRKHLAATLGFLSEDQWKPVTLPPTSQQTFHFAYSTRLLDVSPGESVRVRLTIWPNPESMKDWKAGTTLLTPVFTNPSK